jgi:hypothetical protein
MKNKTIENMRIIFKHIYDRNDFAETSTRKVVYDNSYFLRSLLKRCFCHRYFVFSSLNHLIIKIERDCVLSYTARVQTF